MLTAPTEGFSPESNAMTMLTMAVELAARLAHGRLAWLTLPEKLVDRMHITAATELVSSPVRKLAARSPVRLSSRRSRRHHIPSRIGDRKSDTSADPVPISAQPNASLWDTTAERTPPGDNKTDETTISVPVLLDSGRFGILHVADPIDGPAFREEDKVALQAFAAFVAQHLELASLRRQLMEAQGDVYRLQQTVITTQEEERGRIARDLHDETGHSLTSAIIRLDLAELTLPPEAIGVRATLRQAREGLIDCAEALHRSTFNLRPKILEDLGLSAALRSLVDHALIGNTVQIELVTTGQEIPLPEGLEIAAFRIVQEGLTNIFKHAHATTVEIRLTYTARWLLLTIADDGVGIRPRVHVGRGGTGLRGMRERISFYDGTLMVAQRQGGGTELTAKLPLRGAKGKKDVV